MASHAHADSSFRARRSASSAIAITTISTTAIADPNGSFPTDRNWPQIRVQDPDGDGARRVEQDEPMGEAQRSNEMIQQATRSQQVLDCIRANDEAGPEGDHDQCEERPLHPRRLATHEVRKWEAEHEAAGR